MKLLLVLLAVIKTAIATWLVATGVIKLPPQLMQFLPPLPAPELEPVSVKIPEQVVVQNSVAPLDVADVIVINAVWRANQQKRATAALTNASPVGGRASSQTIATLSRQNEETMNRLTRLINKNAGD